MKMKMINEPLPQGALIQATRAVADAVLTNSEKRKGSWTVNIFGKALKRGLLSMALAGAAAAVFCGCLSVHVHRENDQPSPVIVVPNDHPNP